MVKNKNTDALNANCLSNSEHFFFPFNGLNLYINKIQIYTFIISVKVLLYSGAAYEIPKNETINKKYDKYNKYLYHFSAFDIINI